MITKQREREGERKKEGGTDWGGGEIGRGIGKKGREGEEGRRHNKRERAGGERGKRKRERERERERGRGRESDSFKIYIDINYFFFPQQDAQTGTHESQ